MRNDFGQRSMVAMEKTSKTKLPPHPKAPKEGRGMGMPKGAGMSADGMGCYAKGGAVKAQKVTDGGKAPKAMKSKSK